jgi:hypothetical protein
MRQPATNTRPATPLKAGPQQHTNINRRIDQALQDIFTHEQIPFPDRQAYIDQAREISAAFGPDDCMRWLQPYADDASTRHAEWSRARAAAEAIINGRHQPQAKPDGSPALALGNPLTADTQTHKPDITRRRTDTNPDNPYAAARAGRPPAPVR